jgi:hypothetical protein
MYGHHYSQRDARTIRKLGKIKTKLSKLRDKIAIVEEPIAVATAEN